MVKNRIVSLLPAATEIVYSLGLENELVGVSDDSDFPKIARKLPRVSTTTLSKGLTSKQIDNKVRAAKHRGVSIFHIDEKLLQELNPNLILSQELCDVCAIGASEIKKAARILKSDIKTISLEPESVSDVFSNIRLVGKTTGRKQEAREVINGLKKRLREVRLCVSVKNRPKVLIIEWINPIMVAGHWVPEMVELAGGINLISKKGETSKRITWQDVLKANPDILIIAPCGFDIQRTQKELRILTEKKTFNDLIAVREKRVYLIDGNAYLTRPGPRVVDGIEILSEIVCSENTQRKHSKKDWQRLRLSKMTSI